MSPPLPSDAGAVPANPPRPRLRLLYFLPALIFGALSLLFLFRLYSGDPSRIPSALIGRPVPSFALEPLAGLAADGRPLPGLAEADLKAGAVTVVNVWASWCGPCREEHPLLMDLAKDPSIRVVGINYKDAPENALRFLGTFGNPLCRGRRRPGRPRRHRLGGVRGPRELHRRAGRDDPPQADRAADAGRHGALPGRAQESQGAGMTGATRRRRRSPSSPRSASTAASARARTRSSAA